MNKSDFEAISQRAAPEPVALRGQDLSDRRPRTLIWGFTLERNSFHVYLDEHAVIQVVEYEGTGSGARLRAHWNEVTKGDNAMYLPSKRAYPEACDFEFCTLLARSGHRPVFTTYDDKRDLSKAFHGLRHEEISR